MGCGASTDALDPDTSSARAVANLTFAVLAASGGGAPHNNNASTGSSYDHYRLGSDTGQFATEPTPADLAARNVAVAAHVDRAGMTADLDQFAGDVNAAVAASVQFYEARRHANVVEWLAQRQEDADDNTPADRSMDGT